MRVIAGSARGTRLGPVPSGTRPLSDRAREGLFAHLGEAVVEARCADLFAGTGAVGIEALSRGATWCTFVERSPGAIRVIRDNLTKTGLEERARVVRSDARRFLGRPGGDRPGLVFLDPPYAHPSGQVRDVLRKATEWVTPGGTVVLTRAARDDTDVIPLNWHVAKLLAYGDTHVLVCREGA